MADANNRWVESYLDALVSMSPVNQAAYRQAMPFDAAHLLGMSSLQLSEGLSSEYIKNSKSEDGDVDESTAKFDADRQINSKYFVNQILQQGEEGLRDAWSKVCLSIKWIIHCNSNA